MPPIDPDLVREQDVFALTEKGGAEFRATGTTLSAIELEVLVLLDGSATVAHVIQSAPNLLPAQVMETLRKLARGRLIASAAEIPGNGLDYGNIFSDDGPASQAGATPGQGTSSLRKRGYFVRIARRATARRELKQGQKLVVLVVDDDPDISKLLRTYLRLEGFVARTAGNREEIIAELRQPVKPDLVLLDVSMPDVDGFDVLARIRNHPALKAVPVIMLTAEATREGVLTALRAGVDGYITKPFETDLLITAVKTVLGLGAPPGGKTAAPAKPARP